MWRLLLQYYNVAVSLEWTGLGPAIGARKRAGR